MPLTMLFAAIISITVLAVRQPAATSPDGASVVVAVLPFDGRSAADEFLASGVWEHTLTALARNSSLRLLGRASTAAMAQQKQPPEQYRRRFGVTHVLEGSVRRSGDHVLVSVSLSRTSDGVSVWQDILRAKMGEPFSLEDAIANGIEGKLRGRLAPQGGKRAEQIATTPEVFALYSEARRLVYSRERQSARRAEALLREAVAKDPNFAPGWALLGSAIHFTSRLGIADLRARREASAAVNRALTLAPNLAEAHATSALIQGGGSPAEERALRRAVALDPNYMEAWLWLGNSLASQSRTQEAVAAYERAVEIDPLFERAVQNLAGTASETGNRVAFDRLVRRIIRAGARRELIASVRAKQLYSQGDYSGAANILLEVGLDAHHHSPSLLWPNWLETLTSLGRFEVLHSITGCPEWYAPLLRGAALPPTKVDGRAVSPEEFWTSGFFSTPASRAMVNYGHSKDLVRLYRQGFRNADDFISQTRQRGG